MNAVADLKACKYFLTKECLRKHANPLIFVKIFSKLNAGIIEFI